MLTININRVVEKYTDENSQSFYNDISNELYYGKLVFNDVDSIAYLDAEDNFYFTNIYLNKNVNDLNSSILLDNLKNTTGKNYWYPMTTRKFLNTDSNQPSTILAKKVLNIKTGKTLGYLFLNIHESSIASVIDNQSSNYYILDGGNVTISSNKSNSLLKPLENEDLLDFVDSTDTSRILKINKTDTVVTKVPFKSMDWTLVSESVLKDVTKELDTTNFIMIVLVVLLIIFIILVSNIIANLITHPIEKLKFGMKRVSHGDFSVNLTINSKDELGVLAAGYNKMSSRIETLVSKINEEQEKKRKYELALFQEQIKPHFLYNCLDVIYTLSDMGRNKEAKKTTKALADFYRGTLSGGSEIISLGEEIKTVKDYLSLVRYQYSDVFNYEIIVDDNVLNYKILKLTLQPLVENAIYHGLKNSDKFGLLTIKAYKLDETIILQIIDTGIGMDSIKLNEIQNNFNKSSKTHFGLSSVQDRLKMFFKEDITFDIKSKLNKGTTITITLPLIKGDDIK